jgi:V8-like Glu-specific endopeptidase
LGMDMDSILGENDNGTRLRYRTNTEHGSSGSPCFDCDWNLVALHHYGDPAYHKNPEFNQGIPIRAIRQLLESRGKAGDLGET